MSLYFIFENISTGMKIENSGDQQNQFYEMNHKNFRATLYKLR
jgi:hypothetical protein